MPQRDVPHRAVLTPLEKSVLEAIEATGQGNGWLHDVGAVAAEVGCIAENVNSTVRSLRGKGYLPPLGISDEALEWARGTYAEFLQRLCEGQQSGVVTWRHLGADTLIVRRIRRGAPLRGGTVARLGQRAGFPNEHVAEARRAAEFLYRSKGSGSHQKAKATTKRLHVAAPTPDKWDSLEYTERGAWLRDLIRATFPTIQRFLGTTGMGDSTLEHFFTFTARDNWHPREGPLRTFERTLEIPYAELLQRYDGITREMVMRRSGSHCVVCGRESKQVRRSNLGTCSWACSTLERVRRREKRRGFRADLPRLLWAVMALAAGVSRDRISELVTPPLDAVTDQAALERTVADIGAGLTTRPRELLAVTSEVLNIGYETLRVHLLTGLYRWGDRVRAVPVNFSGTIHVAARLGLTDGEYLRLGGFAGTAKEFASDNMRTQRQRNFRLERGRPVAVARGRPPSRCSLVREIILRRRDGAADDDVINLIETRGIKSVALPKQVTELLVQHGRQCRTCRPGIANELRRSGKTVGDVAGLLDVSLRTAGREIKRGQASISQWRFRSR